MTYTPDLTVARVSASIIILEHCIRQAREAGDYETAKAIWVKIESLSAHARRAAKFVKDCNANGDKSPR